MKIIGIPFGSDDTKLGSDPITNTFTAKLTVEFQGNR